MLFKRPSANEAITQIIALATKPTNEDVDWTMVFQCADLIRGGQGEEGVKACKRRLKSPDPIVQAFTLSCIDAFYTHCGEAFQKPFLDYANVTSLKKIVSGPDFAQENRLRFAQLVQAWLSTATAGGEAAPENLTVLMAFVAHYGYVRPRPYHTQTAPLAVSSAETIVSFENRKRIIERDLTLAENNIRLFSESMSFAAPGEDLTKNEIVQEFLPKLREIQRRAQLLIAEIDDGDLLGQLVKVNEDISQILEKYHFRVSYHQRQIAVREHAEPEPYVQENVFDDRYEINDKHTPLSGADLDHLENLGGGSSRTAKDKGKMRASVTDLPVMI
ncbi:hypothetical protein HDU89_001430 [Geranomyces variabilis]|nr:hypothetical protein HDU89_001430 [Geranomyces variabilis]